MKERYLLYDSELNEDFIKRLAEKRPRFGYYILDVIIHMASNTHFDTIVTVIDED